MLNFYLQALEQKVH